MPSEIKLSVTDLLSPADILALSNTCRDMYAAVNHVLPRNPNRPGRIFLGRVDDYQRLLCKLRDKPGCRGGGRCPKDQRWRRRRASWAERLADLVARGPRRPETCRGSLEDHFGAMYLCFNRDFRRVGLCHEHIQLALRYWRTIQEAGPGEELQRYLDVLMTPRYGGLHTRTTSWMFGFKFMRGPKCDIVPKIVAGRFLLYTEWRGTTTPRRSLGTHRVLKGCKHTVMCYADWFLGADDHAYDRRPSGPVDSDDESPLVINIDESCSRCLSDFSIAGTTTDWVLRSWQDLTDVGDCWMPSWFHFRDIAVASAGIFSDPVHDRTRGSIRTLYETGRQAGVL